MLDKRTDISTLANHSTKASLCFVRAQNGLTSISLCYLKISGILQVCPIFILAALVAPEKAVHCLTDPTEQSETKKKKKTSFLRNLQNQALKAIFNKIHVKIILTTELPLLA